MTDNRTSKDEPATHDAATSSHTRLSPTYVSPVTDEERDYLEMHTLSAEFLRSADILKGTAENSGAIYFLYAHSIELALKCFLLWKGETKKKLLEYDIRHNLPKLLEMAEQHGITMSNATTKMIVGRLDPVIPLRYKFGHNLPLLDDVSAVAMALSTDTKPIRSSRVSDRITIDAVSQPEAPK
jgi:hypothetical protein